MLPAQSKVSKTVIFDTDILNITLVFIIVLTIVIPDDFKFVCLLSTNQVVYIINVMSLQFPIVEFI